MIHPSASLSHPLSSSPGRLYAPITKPAALLPSRPALRQLLLGLGRGGLQIRLQLGTLGLGQVGGLDALVVAVDAADLCGADAEQQGVDGSQGDVLGADDKAPARPDGASAHEGEVLGERQRLGGPREVGGAGGDHGPFHDGGPAGVSACGARRVRVERRTRSGLSWGRRGMPRTLRSRWARRRARSRHGGGRSTGGSLSGRR